MVAYAVAGASSAQASDFYPTLGAANIRSGPTTAAPIATVVPQGTQLAIDCYEIGQSVNGTAIWNHIPGQGYIHDSLLLTRSNDPVVPACSNYARSAAVQWALDHVDDEDSYRYGNDCTWFVSNALWQGGLPKTSDWTDWTINPVYMNDKPWPGPSKAASAADWFKNSMVNNNYSTLAEISTEDRTAGGAQLGDIILYDWDAANGEHHADGAIDHAGIVTAIDGDGSVRISQHSPSRLDKPWALDPSTGQSIGAAGGRGYLLKITY
ncbi:CHAP domain-containing protein [Rathayibacter sp. VKM Ac-2762]|uniref:amidase domain-containing protein n=1 Tax=Rathayibacter sp. VKM Ac-2762 TaxID=2609254 RepID=UPI00132EC86C|nr:amidase domain-containing protein [Rathayibacter sp. VKM Ac-2762]QHF21700.1 CHAP domain-containing protein [Rathayibacter sp. VKM Ac-2762]